MILTVLGIKRGKIFFESWNFWDLEFRTTGIIFSETNWDRNLVFFFRIGGGREFGRLTNVYGILV